MDYFAGLDVSVKHTSVCIVDYPHSPIQLLARAALKAKKLATGI